MPALTVEADAKAARSQGRHHDPVVARTVDRDARRRQAIEPSEEVLHAAQVTRPLLADGGGEDDGPLGGEPSAVDHFRQREHRREATRVVHDARPGEERALPRHGDRGALGKHGVEVRADEHRRQVHRTAAHANDVAYVIRADVIEPQLGEAAGDGGGAARFQAGGRRNLAEGHLRLQQPVVPRGKPRSGWRESLVQRRERLAGDVRGWTHGISMSAAPCRRKTARLPESRGTTSASSRRHD